MVNGVGASNPKLTERIVWLAKITPAAVTNQEVAPRSMIREESGITALGATD